MNRFIEIIRKKESLILLLIIIVLGLIFKPWFTTPVLTGGDWNNLYKEEFNLFSFPPSSWDSSTNLGISTIYILWNILPLDITVSLFGKFLSFHIIALITYFIPFLCIGFVGYVLLFLHFFPTKKIFSYLSGAIFICNTYILMVVGGGQMLLALSYAFLPIVFLLFIQLFESISVSNKEPILSVRSKITQYVLLTGLAFSLQLLSDPRFVYFSVIICTLYYLFTSYLKGITSITIHVKYVLLGTFLTVCIGILQAFWLFPLVLSKQTSLSQLGNAYTYGTNAIAFFSFAKFEDAFALLHPNWPENIFGKVGFLKPEFLLLPLLAYGSLFFLKKKERYHHIIPFFAFIGVLGAFLAKGANEPFGGVYIFLSQHIPGFQLFRDPIKWYALVSFSYALLIPFTLSEGISLLGKIKKFALGIKLGLAIFFVFYFFFLLKPAFLGQLTGTFKMHSIPTEYIELKSLLIQDRTFSRTLWVPKIQRFGYKSVTHPQFSASDFFSIYDNKILIKKLSDPASEKILQEASIGYVIIPFDSEGELILDDRKYSDKVYQQLVSSLRHISYLHPVVTYGKVVVFKVMYPKDHFWTPSKSIKTTYRFISPTAYHVTISNGKKGEFLVFSEGFNTQWVAKTGEDMITSKPYQRTFNSFVLPKDGSYSLEINYLPEKWVQIGLLISGCSLLILILLLFGLLH
jgi:hypothetical protein